MREKYTGLFLSISWLYHVSLDLVQGRMVRTGACIGLETYGVLDYFLLLDAASCKWSGFSCAVRMF